MSGRPLTPLRGAAAVAAAVLVPSLRLPAQPPPGPTVGIVGGAVFPTGSFGDSFKSGYSLGAHVGMGIEGWPVGIRFGGLFSNFDAKTKNIDAHEHVLGFSFSATRTLSGNRETLRPYLVAGAGFYNIKNEVGTASATETKFGLNGGAGLDMPLSGIAVFLEAQLHYVFTGSGDALRSYDTPFVPVVVGVRF